MILPICRSEGFSRVLITCDDDNEASRKVILANGGVAAGSLPHNRRPGHVKLLFWVLTAPA
jgi:predicted acetyltransferase